MSLAVGQYHDNAAGINAIIGDGAPSAIASQFSAIAKAGKLDRLERREFIVEYELRDELVAAGDARVLIASDAATRWLDVDRVGAVVSYDAPTHLKTYVHRVGRTARAGLGGVAYMSS